MAYSSPQTIQVKRKRTDEPVESLYIQDAGFKRRLTGGTDYYFKRVSDKVKASAPPLFHSISAPDVTALHGKKHTRADVPGPEGKLTPSGFLSVPQAARRFRLSRSATASPTRGLSASPSKRKLETPIFYEQTKRLVPESQARERGPSPAKEPGNLPIEETSNIPHKRPTDTPAEKRWREAKNKQRGPEIASTKPEVPTTKPKDIEKFFAFADELDSANGEPPRRKISPSGRSPMRHKPKVPVRIKDRRPAPESDAMEIDTTEDHDLVTDIYIRVPLRADHDVDMTSNQVGLLVIEEPEQKFWDSWIDENALDDTSDKEFETDEEDENAEDYYAADYPEDEVASDDEYGRNPHQYELDASGKEDSDEDEDEDVDSGGEDLQRPWKSHPWK